MISIKLSLPNCLEHQPSQAPNVKVMRHLFERKTLTYYYRETSTTNEKYIWDAYEAVLLEGK